MAFMEPQVTDKQEWIEIDGNDGREFVPAEMFSRELLAFIRTHEAEECAADETTRAALRDYYRGREFYSVAVTRGYGVRLSAPGYMDCTDWSVFTNKREALRAARELAAEE